MADEQGTALLEYITAETEVEWKRREALDRRGAGAVTAASSFTALVVAFLTLLGGKDFVVRAGGSIVATVVALALLLAAGVLGLLAGRPRTYDAPNAAGYETLLATDRWSMSEPDARSAVAQLRLKTLLTLRVSNNAKVCQVQAALVLQLSGVAALAGAVVVQLTT